MVKRELVARERKILLDCIEATYKKFGITRNKESIVEKSYNSGNMFQLEGSKKRMPTLSDLEQVLRQHGGEGITIADELEPYTSGVLSLFNGETNINPDSNFIVFDIKDLEKGLAELAMFITLEFVWNKVKKGDMKKRLLVVDEAWMLMENKNSADYVIRVAKTARKFNAGLSIISQQARDFTKNGGEGIIGNTQMQILLRQNQNDLETLSKMFGLSRNEQGFLKTANPGEALIFANGNHTAVQVVSHEFEHILCTTNPADLERIKDLL
jgi:type IV secretory pathway VirB4 component